MSSTFIDMIEIAKSCDYIVTRKMKPEDINNNLPTESYEYTSCSLYNLEKIVNKLIH